MTHSYRSSTYQRRSKLDLTKFSRKDGAWTEGYKGYPLSVHTFGYPPTYRDELDNELLGKKVKVQSPQWAIRVSQEKNNSGEFPLFAHKYLSPSAVEQDDSSRLSPRSIVKKSKYTRPFSAQQCRPSTKQQYRPNSAHNYLSCTNLKDGPPPVDVHLGKPTRATLLRARQRCHSAPLEAARRREQHKDDHARCAAYAAASDAQRASQPSFGLRSIMSGASGESLHSFLTGARYNRAHCLDIKSYDELGVYMPRNNPLGCFVLKGKIAKMQEVPVPPNPPDTPDTLPDGSQYEAESSERMSIIEQLINMDDGLPNNKKGNMLRQRPTTVRSTCSDSLNRMTRRRPPSATTPNATPIVSVTGTAICNSARNKDHIVDETPVANDAQITIPTQNGEEAACIPPPPSPPPMQPTHTNNGSRVAFSANDSDNVSIMSPRSSNKKVHFSSSTIRVAASQEMSDNNEFFLTEEGEEKKNLSPSNQNQLPDQSVEIEDIEEVN